MVVKPLVQCLQDDVEVVLRRYYDQGVSLAEVIGVLSIVQMNVYSLDVNDMYEDDEGVVLY